MVKMHVDEVGTDASLVRRLLAAQFPQWASLPIEPVPSAGTDNALFRLGDDMSVRMPRIDWAVGQAELEQRWLPKLASILPQAIPVPLALGSPAEHYPWMWSVCRWVEGENPTPGQLTDPNQLATDLAEFISVLHGLDPTDGPPPGQYDFSRGVPLKGRDAQVRESISAISNELDTAAVNSAWQSALDTSVWDRPPVWLHGDLAPGNLLLTNNRLIGVIDWGCLCTGDPACDMMIAWTLFSAENRSQFRAAVQVDDATWERGRGWALSWALIFIPYYLHTNPLGVELARRTIDEVLADRT